MEEVIREIKEWMQELDIADLNDEIRYNTLDTVLSIIGEYVFE